MNDPDFVKVAENHKVTPAQIAVSWALQRGTVPIPKSANVDRMKLNITVSQSLSSLLYLSRSQRKGRRRKGSHCIVPFEKYDR